MIRLSGSAAFALFVLAACSSALEPEPDLPSTAAAGPSACAVTLAVTGMT